MTSDDTIAAIATPPGVGGVGILRISGKNALSVAKQITTKNLMVRFATFTSFYNPQQQLIDEGIAIYFKAPYSFTGEDVVELQGHGGPMIMDQLLQTAIALGARMARPGEFSERAFLNDKLDLTQAEAIADLIHATTHEAAQSAVKSLQGVFSKTIDELLRQLIDIRMFIESAIDFSDEDIDFVEQHQIIDKLEKLLAQIATVRKSAQQGVLLQAGINVVIAGAPNAGKSSLLNCLSGRDSAIVTDIAGTTRDILREYISIDGLPMHVIDTAGLRETGDVIEQEGVKRAKDEMHKADLILWIYDATQPQPQIPQTQTPVIAVANKIDLVDACDALQSIPISAKQNLNIDQLKQAIKDQVGFQSTENASFIARRRHLDALDKTCDHIQHGLQAYHETQAHELLAEDLRLASHSMEEITGKFTSDDLLGKIFSEFCIGK